MPTACEECTDSKTCKSKSRDVCPLFLAAINSGDLFFDPQELQIRIQRKRPRNSHRQFLTLSDLPTPDDINRIGGNRVKIRTYKGLFTCIETSPEHFKVIKFEARPKKKRIPDSITVEESEASVFSKKDNQEDFDWRAVLQKTQREPQNGTLKVISKGAFIKEVLQTLELKALAQ